MWRIILVLFLVVLGFLILRKKMKKPSLDKTNELIDHNDVKDLYDSDILDKLLEHQTSRNV